MLIPDKHYFTLGEISRLTGISLQRLYSWESIVSSLTTRQLKRRRYYQRQDLLIIGELNRLIYDVGHTPASASMQIATQGLSNEVSLSIRKPLFCDKKPDPSLKLLEKQLLTLLEKIQSHNLSVKTRRQDLGA
jgi:DNA-binding transcriptional MerR regulator